MIRVNQCTTRFEIELLNEGYRLIAGIDEVGRGALAGPVVAAAVILDLKRLPTGLNDSKRLTRKQREQLASKVNDTAIAISIKRIEPAEIDLINIHQASLKAMAVAVEALIPNPDFLLIDGFPLKKVTLPQRAIIKGDTLSVSIAAASVVAKVARDLIMSEYDAIWPGYGFGQNVGYGTAKHLTGLRGLGPTPIHRRSFRGVMLEPAQLSLPMEKEMHFENVSKDT